MSPKAAPCGERLSFAMRSPRTQPMAWRMAMQARCGVLDGKVAHQIARLVRDVSGDACLQRITYPQRILLAQWISAANAPGLHLSCILRSGTASRCDFSLQQPCRGPARAKPLSTGDVEETLLWSEERDSCEPFQITCFHQWRVLPLLPVVDAGFLQE